MNARTSSISSIGLVLALTMTHVHAQESPGQHDAAHTNMSDMSGMDHADVPSNEEAHSHSKATKNKKAEPEEDASHDMQSMDHASMQGMQHSMPSSNANAMGGMQHGAMPSDAHGDRAMDAMGPMQGGRPPADARSPDYSDGVGYGSMVGMDMRDNAPIGMLLVDQLEAFDGQEATGQRWEAEGRYGNDRDKVWLRTEGERSHGRVEDADLEMFWNRNIATFWSTQLGVRYDFGEGPTRNWAAFGVQGLAPYWFELEATGYVGENGRTAARLRAEYELLLTQRLILQPEIELNLYGKDDPARRIGSGLSDAQFALRLRYEVTRQFAPYLGVSWVRPLGTTADYAREDHQPLLDRQIVAGVRFWF
jgi:copper resistance protein B